MVIKRDIHLKRLLASRHNGLIKVVTGTGMSSHSLVGISSWHSCSDNFVMEQARKKRATGIFKLKGNVYAFDSTTIPFCLSVFWWAKFRKKKGGVKTHVLCDLESQVPGFFHITTASVHDSKAMKEISYESGSYYVFDRGHNAFKKRYKICNQASQCQK